MALANGKRAFHLDDPKSIRKGLKLLAGPDKADHQQITSSESVEWYTPRAYVNAAPANGGSATG